MSFCNGVRRRWWFLSVAATIWMAGCSSVYMKGTPMYTGEYSKPQGPPEQRVNFWPLAYYHDPALSVLWPLGEKTEDHFAARPLFSIYKLDQKGHEYNFLWPLCQFDFDTRDYRMFPAFWGYGPDDYFVLFPLLYCFGPEAKPFNTAAMFPLFWYQADDYWALFPLFIRSQDGKDRSYHVLWPIFNMKTGEESGWRVWPLAGTYHEPGKSHSYALWPLLYSQTGPVAGESYRQAAPLYFGGRSAEVNWDLALPFFLRRQDPKGSLFVTLLYGQSAASGGLDAWRYLFPLMYQKRTGDSDLWITPLYARADSHEGRIGVIPPLLSWYTRREDTTRLWALGGLAHLRTGGGPGASYLLPLYYHDAERGILVAPILWYSHNDNRSLLVTPLYSQGNQPDFSWRLLLPLYYGSEEEGQRTWITPLVGRIRSGGDTWIFPPLLSGGSSDSQTGNGWFSAIFPFSYFSWGPDARGSHVLPLYFHHVDGPRQWWIVPPLLGWALRDENNSEYDALLGLASFGSKGEDRNSRFLPFYLYRREGSESQFLSLPYSQVKSPNETITCFLATLYRQVRGTSPEEREDGILWPLTNWQSNETEGGSWFWPLYRYAARKDGRGTRGFFLWPFFHFDTHQPRQWKLLLPLFYSYRHESPQTLNRGFVSLPTFWYFRSVQGGGVKAADASQSVAARDETNTGLFPLWHYTREIAPPRTASDFSILGWLYDHHYQRTPKEKEAGEDEYTRSRVLWRLMHYENHNGDSSLDLFPFITMDHKPSSDFHKFSFAWRLFRYEREGTKSLKLDILFVPVRRVERKDEG